MQRVRGRDNGVRDGVPMVQRLGSQVCAKLRSNPFHLPPLAIDAERTPLRTDLQEAGVRTVKLIRRTRLVTKRRKLNSGGGSSPEE